MSKPPTSFVLCIMDFISKASFNDSFSSSKWHTPLFILYITLYIMGLAKKFISVFVAAYGKNQTNFLANPIFPNKSPSHII